MLRFALCAVSVVYIATAASPVRAQAVSTHIPVLTRLVKNYSDYERRLAEAVNRKDFSEINQLLANDFELRPANNIGVPTPRVEWIAQSFQEPPSTVLIEQMAVHDYGNIRIVSFVMKLTATPGPERDIAVVDVWMQSGDNSVLKVRYAAIQNTRSIHIPGESRQQNINK
jgi:hypothetical protein